MQTFDDYKGENLFLNRYESCVLEWCDVCVEDFGPLVKLLRLADGENKPFVGFIFGELLETKSGAFGRAITLRGCQQNDEKFEPGNWWSLYGCHVPTLQRLAIKILSLTPSSSSCERNWSAFEGDSY
ncbi:unnamed protein product [Arabidopsis thaliana]|uniref:HAT C-terminal dimerisation domain-containing protein n=1 Tax=Arabidopsis thaliana TaxID=3702 RepID=A0A5S9Y8G4_ARATH|nr:unnamed protein product [Arabidopsis thaliana]